MKRLALDHSALIKNINRRMHYTPPYKAFVYRNKPSDFAPTLAVAACCCEFNGKYLFLKRALGKPQENTWGMPAGKMEEGETPREAVSRETFEEVAITLDQETLRDEGKLFVRYPHLDFTYYIFHQEFTSFPKVTLSDEHTEYRWLTFEEALELPLISGGAEALHHFKALAKKPKLKRKEFYFIRHGETDANIDPNLKEIDDDLPLNKRGKEQAALVRTLVATLPLSRVCSSPMQRAKETKDIVANGLELLHFEIAELTECKAAGWMKMVRMEKGREFFICAIVEQFIFRALSGVNTAIEQDGPVLVVAHGGIHWALCYYMQIENHSWKAKNCKLMHFSPVGEMEWKVTLL